MSVSRTFAVILLEHNGGVGPTPTQARHFLLTSSDSVAKYWEQCSNNWFTFAAVDCFGPYAVTLPPPPSTRSEILRVARAAAAADGVDLSAYNHCIVIVSLGQVNGTGYDGGTYGSANIMQVFNSHSLFAHEIGHLLGFGDTYGIPNTGGDWNNNGEPNYFPIYGDPYDIMSAESFAHADPTTTLPTAAGFPGSERAGPMVSRAALHFYHPLALETIGQVRHCYEGGDLEYVTLHSAGSAVRGGAELLVFHPAGEDDKGRGRVYVEYRQPFDHYANTRWDAGLAAAGDERDRRGIVIHVIRDAPGTTIPVVWYSGRICFPTPDTDVIVDTPKGSVVVHVSQEQMYSDPPGFVRVRVDRQSSPGILVETSSEDAVRVISTEKRPIPGWEIFGEFTWERRETTRKTRFRPFVFGIGGRSPYDAQRSVSVTWFVGNVRLTTTSGTAIVSVSPSRAVEVLFEIDPKSGELTLTNRPADGAYSIPVEAQASDDVTQGRPLVSVNEYEVEGMSEGWGEDYDRFMEFWDRITHPYPAPRFGPPKPDEIRIVIDRIYRSFEDLEGVRPDIAGKVRPMVVDQVRALRRLSM